MNQHTVGGKVFLKHNYYEGGSIFTLGFYAICQSKDQSVAIIMVHKK